MNLEMFFRRDVDSKFSDLEVIALFLTAEAWKNKCFHFYAIC